MTADQNFTYGPGFGHRLHSPIAWLRGLSWARRARREIGAELDWMSCADYKELGFDCTMQAEDHRHNVAGLRGNEADFGSSVEDGAVTGTIAGDSLWLGRTGSGPLPLRRRVHGWYWAAGGRHLYNARITLRDALRRTAR